MASIKYSCMSLLLLSSSTILAEQREANVRPLHLATLGGGESSSSKHRRGLIGREFCQTQGDCASCFGPGYILCPGAAITCYKPGDPNYGIDSCSPGSSSPSSSARSTYTPTATASVAGSSYTIPSFCSNGGRNCAQCFGAGYIQCSADSTHCYNPNDPDSVCPGGSSGGSAPSSGSSRPASSAPSSPSSPSAAGAPSGTSSLPSATGSTGGGSCAAEYGSSYVNCGTDSCYNPSTEVCCSDGSHCYTGETCSSTPGLCDYSYGYGTNTASPAGYSATVGGGSSPTGTRTTGSSTSYSGGTIFTGTPNSGGSGTLPSPGSQSSANGHVVNTSDAPASAMPMVQMLFTGTCAILASVAFLVSFAM